MVRIWLKKKSNTFFTVSFVAREMAASNGARNNIENNIHTTIISTQYLENITLVDLSLALCFQLHYNTGAMSIFLCFLLLSRVAQMYREKLATLAARAFQQYGTQVRAGRSKYFVN